MSNYVWVILKEDYEEDENDLYNGYIFIPAGTEGFVNEEDGDYLYVIFDGAHREVYIEKDKVINIIPTA